MVSSRGLLSAVFGIGIILCASAPAHAQPYRPKRIWFNPNTNNVALSKDIISRQTTASGLGVWGPDPVLGSVNVIEFDDVFLDTNYYKQAQSITGTSGLAQWLTIQHLSENGSSTLQNALAISISFGSLPLDSSGTTCSASIIGTSMQQRADDVADTIAGALPTDRSINSTLFLNLDEPLRTAWYQNPTNLATYSCGPRILGKLVASVLQEYVQRLQMDLGGSNAISLTVVMGDTEPEGAVVRHEGWSSTNGDPALGAHGWESELVEFFASFYSANTATALSCGPSGNSICLEPNLEFFHFDTEGDDSGWVANAARLTTFLRSSDFTGACSTNPILCNGAAVPLVSPEIAPDIDDGQRPGAPAGQYLATSFSETPICANLDASFVATSEANLQEYFNSGDMPLGTMPEDVAFTSWDQVNCVESSTTTTSTGIPETIIPSPTGPNPPLSQYSVLNYFNGYISQVASNTASGSVVQGSQPPTSLLRFTNASSAELSSRSYAYGPDRTLSGSDGIGSMQSQGWQLQYPLGDLFTTNTSATGANSSGTVPLKALYLYADTATPQHEALSLASAKSNTYILLTYNSSSQTRTFLTGGPLGSNYVMKTPIGYVFPPTDVCSVPLFGGVPASDCSDAGRIPVFQFHKTSPSGEMIYAYTTDYCPGCSSTANANSEGNGLLKLATAGGGGYQLDGIVFFVAGALPVAAPAEPNGQSAGYFLTSPEIVSPLIIGRTLLESGGRPLLFSNGTALSLPASNVAATGMLVNSPDTEDFFPVSSASTSPVCEGDSPLPYTLQCFLEINGSNSNSSTNPMGSGFTETDESSSKSYALTTNDNISSDGTAVTPQLSNQPFAFTISNGFPETSNQNYPLLCLYDYHDAPQWSSEGSNSICY